MMPEEVFNLVSRNNPEETENPFVEDVATYTGEITSLKENEIFVFGSNEGSSTGRKPTHGLGNAKVARDKFGAIQGQPRGLQGQSYGIVTKKFWDKERSSSPEEIKREIQNLYAFATNNPDKILKVAYMGGPEVVGNSGYTNAELASMFAAFSIPSNVQFEVEFAKGINFTPSTKTTTGVKGFQGYKGGFPEEQVIDGKLYKKGSENGDPKDYAMRQIANSAIVELASNKESSSKTSLGELGLPKEGDKVIMLARNGSLSGKALRAETKEQIRQANLDDAEFVVGDMAGVDSQFIDYLKEIGAKFTVYHTGTTPRIQLVSTSVKTQAPVGTTTEEKLSTPEEFLKSLSSKKVNSVIPQDVIDLYNTKLTDGYRNKTTIEQFYKLLSNGRRMNIDDDDFIKNMCK
jgi:hypothetical protein